jgi:hypothetical protein
VNTLTPPNIYQQQLLLPEESSSHFGAVPYYRVSELCQSSSFAGRDGGLTAPDRFPPLLWRRPLRFRDKRIQATD